MSEPLVTVVTPTRNRLQLLQETLDSVAARRSPTGSIWWSTTAPTTARPS